MQMKIEMGSISNYNKSYLNSYHASESLFPNEEYCGSCQMSAADRLF